MKNIGGNEISIFLFRFEKHVSGIDFVLNEAIANDMQPDINEILTLLIESCCFTLLRYKHLAVGNVIMDGSILLTGQFEVMLCKGLGSLIPYDEKTQLFQNAKQIADQLSEVMKRASKQL